MTEEHYRFFSELVGPTYKSYERRFLKYKRRWRRAVRIGKPPEAIERLRTLRDKYCYMAYPG